MIKKSNPLAGERPANVANDNRSARPKTQILGGLEVVGVQVDRAHELQIGVEAGLVEFIIAGKIGIVETGGLAVVPRGAAYAYRNTTTQPARLVIRALVPGAKTSAA